MYCRVIMTIAKVLCTKCLYRPIVTINQQYTNCEVHYIYLHIFLCVWFYKSLSLNWPCFSWKSNGMRSKWKSLQNSSVWQQPCHHRYKEKIKYIRSFIIFNNDSCFQNNLQHNYPNKKRRTTIHNVSGNANDVSD